MSYPILNNKWERKPRQDNPKFKDIKKKDLFLCHKCKGWWSWFIYDKGKILALNDNNSDNTYDYMNDDEDRKGQRWACNYCIDKLLFDNNMITITNIDGKIISNISFHPILKLN